MELLSEATQMHLLVVLMHFLWQGTAVATAAATLMALLRSPRGRYAAALIAFLLMSAMPLVTWCWLDATGADDPTQAPIIWLSDASDAVVLMPDADRHTTPNRGVSSSERLAVPLENDHAKPQQIDLANEVIELAWSQSMTVWTLRGWVLGVCLLSLRFALGAATVWCWRWGSQPLSDSLSGMLDDLQRRWHLKLPSVRLSTRLRDAVALGLFKPLILLPVSWVTELPPDMLEAVLAHELAHIRRFDLWINVVQGVVETLLFYHPAVWWLSRRLRIERELCCDEWAARLTQDRLRYAEMLERIARMAVSSQTSSFSLAVSSREGPLLQRVRQILEPMPQQSERSVGIVGLLTVAGVLLVTVSIRSAQQINVSKSGPIEAVDAANVPATTAASDYAAANESALLLVDLPGGRSVELVGLTRNTSPARDGWKPDGTPIGDVGHWPSTIVLHNQNLSSAYVNNGPHPQPDVDAVDLLFRFGGLREQPSLTFEMASNGTNWHRLPLKDRYEFRVATRRRGEPPRGTQWRIPDGEVRIGLTDEPWGKWVKVAPDGKVLAPSESGDLYHRLYDNVLIHEVIEHERTPNRQALVLCQPKNHSSLYAFEVRGIDEDGTPQWVLEWESKDVQDADLREGHWGLSSAEKKPLARYEFRLRPYRHWVTVTGVRFEPGPAAKVGTTLTTIPDPDRPATISQLRNGREIELIGVTQASVATQVGSQRKADAWWKPNGSKLKSEPFKLPPLLVAPGKQKFFEFALKTRMTPGASKEGPWQKIPLVMHGGLWSGSREGHRLRAETWHTDGYMQHQFILGVDDDSKPGTLSFYYSDQNAVAAGSIDLSGNVSVSDEATPEAKSLLESLQLAGVDKRPHETVVRFKPNGLLQQALQLCVVGFCSDGRSVQPVDAGDYEQLVFKHPASELEALQLNVRPMTHRVDCEDIALMPGQKCDPRVTVTPLDECFAIAFRKDGRTLGILSDTRPGDLKALLKLLQPELNSSGCELVVETQKTSAFERAERIVRTLKTEGWKWPAILLKEPSGRSREADLPAAKIVSPSK